jgi:hypothetical protein
MQAIRITAFLLIYMLLTGFSGPGGREIINIENDLFVR